MGVRNQPRRWSSRLAVTCLVVVLVAAACSDDGGAGDEPTATEPLGAIAMSFGGLDIEVWNPMLVNIENIVEAAGYEFLTHDPMWDVQVQVTDWETWIARGDLKSIMGFPISADALVPVTQTATEEGIPVLGYVATWPGVTASFTTEAFEHGQLLGTDAAEWILETYGDEPVDAAVLGPRDSDLGIQRMDGIIDSLNEMVPNVTIRELEGASRQSGFDQAQSLLQVNPDTKVWLSWSDDNLLGAYRALLDSGVAADDPSYFLGALDATNETLDIMAEEGSIWRVSWAFDLAVSSGIVAEMLIDAAEGKPMVDRMNAPERVTLENVDEYRYLANPPDLSES